MKREEFDRRYDLVMSCPKAEEWVRHKCNWEHISWVGVLEDFWDYVLEIKNSQSNEETKS